jgi:predicted site-specific integrase-resolvase
MPVEIQGKRFYRTNEALKIIGISKATWFRWLKEKKVEDVAHKDIRGWRLFTEEEVERIRKYANTINILPRQETLDLER